MYLRLISFLLLCLVFFLPEAWSVQRNSLDASPARDGRQRMADNFFIIYDPSTTMDVPYKNTGLTRLEAQKKILRESNACLPELNWQAGLYPHWKGQLWLHGSPMAYKPYYRLQLYKKAAFAAAIEELPQLPEGPPMLQTGLMKLEHLLGLPGRTQIFLFSGRQLHGL